MDATMKTDVVFNHVDKTLDLGYTRKSQEAEDKQVTSNEDQIQIIKQNALDKCHITLLDSNIFSDSKTGQKAGVRPNFSCMRNIIDEAIQKGYKVRLHLWDCKRAARNGEEGGYLADHVRRGNLEIITDIAGSFDQTNFFMLYIHFGMGSQESKNTSDGVKRNNDFKLRQMIYPGKPHLGYMYDHSKAQGQKDHVPNPKNHDKCREWVELMLTGQYTVDGSLELMTARGLLGNKGEPVSRTKAYKFFRDIFNTGLFVFKGKTFQGCHRPLMTMAEYNKIQRIIDSRGHKQDLSNPLWFQGIEILKCGYCGGSITGEKHKKAYLNGSEQWFYHARCTKKRGPCPEKFLNANQMKDQIDSFIDEMEIAQEYIVLIRKVLKRQNQAEFQQVAKERELQTKRLEAIDKQKETLYGMKAEGFYDTNLEEYEKKKADLLRQELLVKQEIMPDSTAYWAGLLEDACDFVVKMKDLFKNGDAYTKQMVLRILGSNLKLEDKKIKIEAKTTFIAIKRVQQEISQQMGWLEPQNGLSQSSKDDILHPSLPYSSA